MSERAAARRPLPALLLCAVALAVPRAAQAQDAATAQALYEEGEAALLAGRVAEACTKFDASYRLVPTTVNLGALAQCHERIGRTASAAGELERLAGEYRQRGKTDKEREARARAAALEGKIPRLVVRLSAEARAVPGLEVTRDDQRLESALIDSLLPVDPGSHTVTAKAPGFTTWVTVVEVGGSDREKQVIVPGLVRREIAGPALEARAPGVGDGSSGPALPGAPTSLPPGEKPGEDAATRLAARQRLGLALGGSGVVMLGAGIFLGYRTFSKQAEARDTCPRVACSDLHAIELNDTARSTYPFALGATILGAGALGAGTYFYFSKPEAFASGALSVRPFVGREATGLAAAGIF